MSVSHFRTTTLILAALTLVAQGAARADALADGRLISASVGAPDYRSGGPLAFGRLRTLTPEPAVGRTCEIDIGLTATFDDPFNPEQISVDADNRSWGATSFAGITTHTVAKNMTLKVDNLRDGAASVEWVDPRNGTTVRRETVSVRGGAVTLSAGNVLKDVACHLRYR